MVNKTTVYLPEELEARLDAVAASTGTSKAELIRRGIAMVVETAKPPKRHPLPVFQSGRARSVEQMDDEIYTHIKERSERR